ncbi:MAG: isoprenylcysteine carboxylmethyltransferase family protein [Rivihabitans pingtungensis]|jgi:protein-S-isoprenylcysteine O-methyltransferase Ste14
MSLAPQPIARPPRLYLGTLLLSTLAHLRCPWPLWLSSWWRGALALPLLVCGGLLAWSAFATLRRAGTTGHPGRPNNELVTHGPFAWSRNPVYVAMTALYFALALEIGSVWPLLAWLPLWLLMHYGVIRREEAYLLRRFGQAYANYLQHTRRWL